MTDKEKIKAEIERRIKAMKDNFATNEASKSKHAYTLRMIDHQELLSFINSLPEEPVSEDLEEAANFYADTHTEWFDANNNPHVSPAFKAGAKWQKENLWKPADGDDLPEIDREVIALLDNGKVVFAHRSPEYWNGKDIITGRVTRHYPKTYDKGGWNIPNVKYWLDVELPKEIEL